MKILYENPGCQGLYRHLLEAQCLIIIQLLFTHALFTGTDIYYSPMHYLPVSQDLRSPHLAVPQTAYPRKKVPPGPFFLGNTVRGDRLSAGQNVPSLDKRSPFHHLGYCPGTVQAVPLLGYGLYNKNKATYACISLIQYCSLHAWQIISSLQLLASHNYIIVPCSNRARANS